LRLHAGRRDDLAASGVQSTHSGRRTRIPGATPTTAGDGERAAAAGGAGVPGGRGQPARRTRTRIAGSENVIVPPLVVQRAVALAMFE
jgi:hypothetical protein